MDPAPSAPLLATPRRSYPLAWYGVCALGLLLLVVHLLWYRVEPMGRFPVMDGYYNVQLAAQMAAGTLPAEPFFRAPLYPFLLSLPLRLGVPLEVIPDLARLLNVVAFLFCLWGMGQILRRFEASAKGGALALGLFACNPLVHFYAGDPYDILLAMALMVWFVRFAAPALGTVRFDRSALWASLLLAVAAGLRSHFLPLAVLWPLALGLSIVRQCGWNARLVTVSVGGYLPLAGVFALLALGQFLANGQLRATPWQGPYMLYVTNHPDRSPGYIYQQQFDVSRAGTGRFPVEEEARRLFTTTTGEPFSVDTANRYYRSELKRAVLEHPLQWVRYPLRRAYALINNHEQYDNKTWSLQKPLQPVLRWNPVGWGVLFVAGTMGLVGLWRRKPALGLTVLLAFLGYSVVIVLVLANSRYRLPLYPLLAVAAAWIPTGFATAKGGPRWTMLAAGAVAAFLTFTHWGGVAAADTRVSDYVLMAHAAQQAGEDREAWRWLEEAEAAQPGRLDVAELRLTTALNLSLQTDTAHLPWAELAAAGLELVAQTPEKARPPINFLAGYAAYRAGEDDAAQKLWRWVRDRSPEAAASLQWVYGEAVEELTTASPLAQRILDASTRSPDARPPFLARLFPRAPDL